MRMSQNPRSALGCTQAKPTVAAPTERTYFRAPKTYGVRPDDAMPTRTSFRPKGGDKDERSVAPSFSESSAPSTAFRMAQSPPAIIPTNCPGGAEKVGGLTLREL